MADCEWCQDEICVNADCPMCCDYCPVPDMDLKEKIYRSEIINFVESEWAQVLVGG